ncbi:P-loop NTPase fold protein [Vallitalea okinawensis]|uniref:P-loop NTPase fold protein n=1 Tax=Vallitalea okinawensis TaxID=2078660 RepID=UPI000CFCC361|nr:P-loop NTPase fold protein [Vallitalea okinawensis]
MNHFRQAILTNSIGNNLLIIILACIILLIISTNLYDEKPHKTRVEIIMVIGLLYWLSLSPAFKIPENIIIFINHLLPIAIGTILYLAQKYKTSIKEEINKALKIILYISILNILQIETINGGIKTFTDSQSLTFIFISIYIFLLFSVLLNEIFLHEESEHRTKDEEEDNEDKDKLYPWRKSQLDQIFNILNNLNHNNNEFCIGIVGKWGLGKSYLIDSFKGEIANKNYTYEIIEINAFFLEDKRNMIQKLENQLRIIFDKYNIYSGIGSDLSQYISSAKDLIGDDKKKYIFDKIMSSFITPNSFKVLKNRLENTIMQLKIENKMKGIIVIIDDLDRCNEDIITDTLRFIKEILNLSCIIPILVYDEDYISTVGQFSREFMSKYVSELIHIDSGSFISILEFHLQEYSLHKYKNEIIKTFKTIISSLESSYKIKIKYDLENSNVKDAIEYINKADDTFRLEYDFISIFNNSRNINKILHEINYMIKEHTIETNTEYDLVKIFIYAATIKVIFRKEWNIIEDNYGDFIELYHKISIEENYIYINKCKHILSNPVLKLLINEVSMLRVINEKIPLSFRSTNSTDNMLKNEILRLRNLIYTPKAISPVSSEKEWLLKVIKNKKDIDYERFVFTVRFYINHNDRDIFNNINQANLVELLLNTFNSLTNSNDDISRQKRLLIDTLFDYGFKDTLFKDMLIELMKCNNSEFRSRIELLMISKSDEKITMLKNIAFALDFKSTYEIEEDEFGIRQLQLLISHINNHLMHLEFDSIKNVIKKYKTDIENVLQYIEKNDLPLLCDIEKRYNDSINNKTQNQFSPSKEFVDNFCKALKEDNIPKIRELDKDFLHYPSYIIEDVNLQRSILEYVNSSNSTSD